METPFNAVDYLLIAAVLISAVVGLFRGFVKEAMSLVVWILAIWFAWRFGSFVSARLPDFIDDPVLKLWAARLIALIAVMLIGGLVTALFSYLLNMTGLTGTDRVVGMVFGFARGLVVAGLVVIVLQIAGFEDDPWWAGSKLIPYAAPVAERLREAAEDGIDLLQTTGDEQ